MYFLHLKYLCRSLGLLVFVTLLVTHIFNVFQVPHIPMHFVSLVIIVTEFHIFHVLHVFLDYWHSVYIFYNISQYFLPNLNVFLSIIYVLKYSSCIPMY